MMRAPGLLLLLAAAAVIGAEAPPPAPADMPGPLIELRGKVVRVIAARGQGMPYMELAVGSKTSRVQLGSMRYLMQQDFNPKAGEEAVVEGFERGGEVVAMRVRLVGTDRTLELRDRDGRPLWQRGRFGQR